MRPPIVLRVDKLSIIQLGRRDARHSLVHETALTLPYAHNESIVGASARGYGIANWLITHDWGVPYRDCKCEESERYPGHPEMRNAGIWGRAAEGDLATIATSTTVPAT